MRYLIILLLLTSLASAQVIEGSSCITDAFCEIFKAQHPNAKCDIALKQCVTGEGAQVSAPPQANTTAARPTTNTTNITIPAVAPPQGTVLSTVLEKVAALEEKSKQTDTKLAEVEQKATQAQTQANSLNTQVQQLAVQEKQGKDQLQQDLSAVVTGLAGLQKNIADTDSKVKEVEESLEKRSRTARVVTYAFIFLIIIATGLIIFHYINAGRKESSPVDAETKKFITHQIKQGKNFAQIKAKLARSGWSANDIEEAYKHTTQANYKNYKKPSPQGHKDITKIGTVLVVSVLFIIGALFLLRGATTGQAIHFPSEADLNQNVEKLLNQFLSLNAYSPVTDFAHLCVQVNDVSQTASLSASYEIFKTPKGHAIKKAAVSCDNNSTRYDAAIKFLDFASFQTAMRSPRCDTFRTMNQKETHLVVLPSRFVAPGFKAQGNYTRFCPALRKCLSAIEFQKFNLAC